MKKILQLPAAFAIAAVLLVSCKSSKQAVVATHGDLKGTWVVNSTSIEGLSSNDKVNVTVFDEAALSCFNGSEWYFPNNGYGTYTITQSACGQGARKILWSQRTRDGFGYLNFKYMDGVKRKDSKRVEEGYSLQVTSFDKNGFIAKSPVLFEGKTIYIVYDFVKK